MNGRNWSIFLHMKIPHIFLPKVMNQISGLFGYCMSFFTFLFLRRQIKRIYCVGEYIGLRSRFKRALVNHLGIFYLSTKTGMHTVLLKEAYKRGLLIEKHPLMEMRYQYIHLMNTVKEDNKPINAPGTSPKKEQKNASDTSGEKKVNKWRMLKVGKNMKVSHTVMLRRLVMTTIVMITMMKTDEEKGGSFRVGFMGRRKR